MPHLTLEYSANLRDGGQIQNLCQKLAQTLIAQDVFPLGGIRVRAVPCEDFCIADGRLPDAVFIHGTLKIGAGRTSEVKQKTLDDLFAVMKSHFAAQFERHGLALSLELYEFSDAGALKHNNLHALLKQG